MVAVGLAVFLLTGPLAGQSGGQGRVRGISVFPEPEIEGAIPRTGALPLPESAYVAAAFPASLATFPHRAASCAAGQVLGFFVGSVLRLAVWTATIGDQVGSSEGLDRVGRVIVENTCGDSMFVSADDLKQPQPLQEQQPAPVAEAR